MLRNLLVLFLCFSLSFVAFAIEDGDLFQTTVTANSQEEAERQQLFQEGFYRLLERLTAKANLEYQPEVKQAASHIITFVDKYAYDGNQLTIYYSPALIKELLHRLGHTVEAKSRPKLMVWLVVDENGEKRLVGEESDPKLVQNMQRIASSKAIPLVFPMLDIEEVSIVGANDVWDLNLGTLVESQERYGTQGMLIGRLHHQETWEGDWMLYYEGQTYTFNSDRGALERVLMQGITDAASQFSPTVTLDATPKVRDEEKVKEKSLTQQSYLLYVDNIQTGQDFSRVEMTLRNLGPVKRVTVAEVLQGSAIFEVTLKASQDNRHLLAALDETTNLRVGLKENISQQVDIALRFQG